MGNEPSEPSEEIRRCSSCGAEMKRHGQETADATIPAVCDDCLDAETLATPPPAGAGKRGSSQLRSLLSLGLDDENAVTNDNTPTEAWSDSLQQSHASGSESSPIPEDGMIGKFQIVERIGSGGFGDVYRARQYDPVEREVALKVLKPGMSSREIVHRFEAERQTLAMMEHPNIARVIDAGETPSGNPYFVMELVRGEPVTAYCDRKKLGVRARLAIFQQICAGVQHAHQKGIIHRDLKPSNILVEENDGKPLPKVIDFGVSKAMVGGLAEMTVFTQAGQAIGTPQYMSPEQAVIDEQGVDTRSDIFSLGVILYELLTGETPITSQEFHRAGMMAFADLIQEKTPARPSTRIGSVVDTETVAKVRRSNTTTLRKTLRQDLDWIVMKALEKERERRYGSAAAFSDDVKRYLSHEPVVASPPSRIYAMKKFTRRHRGSLLAGATILGVVILGAVVSIWQALRAMEESERARMAERQSALQRDAANAVNLIASEPQRALEIMNRVTEESELLFGSLSPPVTNALVQVLDGAREASRFHAAPKPVTSDTRGEESLTAIFTAGTCYLFDLKKNKLRSRITLPRKEGDSVRSLGLFPGGERVIAGFGSGDTVIFSTVEGSEITRWNAGEGVAVDELEVSADGERIITLNAEGVLARWTGRGEAIGDPVSLNSSAIPDFLAADSQAELSIASGTYAEAPFFSITDFASPDPTPLEITTPGKATSALAVRSDGQRFLTGFQDGTIQIWNRDGSPVGVPILAHRSMIWRVAFVEGTNWIASAASDGEVRIWGESGEAMSPAMAGVVGEVLDLSSLENGRFLVAVFKSGTVIVWDNLGAQARSGTFTGSAAGEVLFPESKPDEMLAGLADGRVVAIDWKKTNSVKREIRASVKEILRMRLNHDENLLAAVVRGSPDLYLIEYPALANLRKIPTNSEGLSGLEFAGANDEQILLYGNDGVIHSMDVRSGKVESIAETGNSSDSNNNMVRLRTPIPPYTHVMFGGHGLQRTVLFSPSGDWTYGVPRGIVARLGTETSEGIAIADSKSVRFGRRPTTNKSFYDFPENVRSSVVAKGMTLEQIAYSQASTLLAAGTTNGLLRFFSESGTSLSPLLRAHRIGIETVSCHPTDPIFVTTGHDGWIRFWGSHPELWKNSLSERVSTALPENHFSMPSIYRKGGKGSTTPAGWESAISVPTAGFAMKANPIWKKASPASVAAMNQLIVQGLGDQFKRMRFASVHYNQEKTEKSAFLQSDSVVTIEIPEFTHPYAMADRLPDLAKRLYEAIGRSMEGVLSLNSENFSLTWNEEKGGAVFRVELDFTANRKGIATGFWIPSHESSVIVGSIMSHKIIDGDPDATRRNAVIQNLFHDSVFQQMEEVILHEDHRLTPEELAEVKNRIDKGSITLVDRLMRGQFVEVEKALENYEINRRSNPEKAYEWIEKYISIARTAEEKASSISAKNAWRRKLVPGIVKRSQLYRDLGRGDDSLAGLMEALPLVDGSDGSSPYDQSAHRQLLREFYYTHSALGDHESRLATAEDLVGLSRASAAESSSHTDDLKHLADDIRRLCDALILDETQYSRVETLLKETLEIASELAEDRNTLHQSLDMTRAGRAKLSTLAGKQGKYEEALEWLRKSLDILSELRQYRPDYEPYQKTLAKDLRTLAHLQYRTNDETNVEDTFRTSLEETTQWIHRFASKKRVVGISLDWELVGRKSLFSQLEQDGQHEWNADLKKMQIDEMLRWPDQIQKDRTVARLLGIQMENLAHYRAVHTNATASECLPLVDKAEEVLRPWVDHDDPAIRRSFLGSYLNTIIEKSWIHGNTPSELQRPWPNSEMRDWMEKGVSRIPKREELTSEKNLALIARICQLLSYYGWKTNSAEGPEKALPLMVENTKWQRHALSISSTPSRKMYYADALRAELHLVHHSGHRQDADDVNEKMKEADSIFEQLLAAPNPDMELDLLKKAAEFYQSCLLIHRAAKNFEEAEEAAKSSVDLWNRHLERLPKNESILAKMAHHYYNTATYSQKRDIPAAVAAAEKSMDFYEKLSSQPDGKKEKYQPNIERVGKLLSELRKE